MHTQTTTTKQNMAGWIYEDTNQTCLLRASLRACCVHLVMEYLQTQFSPLLFLSSFTTPTDYKDDTTCFNIHFGNPESILNEWVFHKVLYKEVLWNQRVHFLLGLVDEAPLRDNLHSSQDLPLPPPIIQPTPHSIHGPIFLIQALVKSAASQIPSKYLPIQGAAPLCLPPFPICCFLCDQLVLLPDFLRDRRSLP